MKRILNGELVDMSASEITTYNNDRSTEYSSDSYYLLKISELDLSVSKEKYQDIKNGRQSFDPYCADAIYEKHCYTYALSNEANKVLGVFQKYGDLPVGADEGDVAYNKTLSGLLLTKPSGVYQFTGGSWVLRIKYVY